jgi:hypothetical protein
VDEDAEPDVEPDLEPDVEPDVDPDTEPDTGECVADCFDEGASRCNDTAREVCLSTDDCLSWSIGEDRADGGELCDSESREAQCVEEFIPTCDDELQNDAETAVDCGGSACDPCDDGVDCLTGEDCTSGVCSDDLCALSTCSNDVLNGDETDVDCVGPACTKCDVGEGFESASDCTTGICDFLDSNTCVDATPSFNVDEDWETGDLTSFDWAQTGPNFEIETDGANCHGGDFCLRYENGQLSSTTTTIETDLLIRENTTVSFGARLNNEPDEHFLRFYINDELVFERSGQLPWTEYLFPVLAAAAGAENTSFRWEYERSAFVSGEHVAWNDVWVDDTDMPAWNTEPSVLEQSAA